MDVAEREQMRLEEAEDKEKSSLTDSGSDGEPEREHWSHKMDSMFSLVGYCVGLGNIWRFPYFCMRNGGGSFLIAFLFFLVVCGLPMYFVDMTIGQFTGKTSLHAWEICPLLKGIGHGVIVVDFVISSYYSTILAWNLFYLKNSFYSPLPWTTCDNDWNTDSCIEDRHRNTLTSNVSLLNATILNATEYSTGIFSNSSKHMVTSEEEFWQRGVLQLSSGIEELGGVPWQLVICLFITWTILFLCLVRGIHSSGKVIYVLKPLQVVYVTASLPYILLTILLIRASLLPGAGDGILYYITPDMKRLGELQVWLEAALQVFYSLCPAWGPIITLASYNKFDNNCYKDSIILTFICEGTSIFGGFVVFAVLGFMAHETGMHISEVVTSGPGLVFMTYPEALAQLPLPNLWSVLFFLMILSVGLDSQFSHMETLVTALLDQFPSFRRRRVVIHGCVCFVWFLFGIIMVCQGGMYVFYLMDWYIGLSIPVFGFIECIIVGWIYGAERFSRDLTMMIGHGIPVIMRIALCFVVPAILLFIAVFAFGTYEPPTYGDYQYPAYAITIGLMMGVTPFVPVVILAFVAIRNAPGDTFREKLVNSTKPSPIWKPASKEHARGYGYHEVPEYSSAWSTVKVNCLGRRKK